MSITFTARDIGSRTLVVLLVFNFSTSNVNSRQVENHPVVWKIMKFKEGSVHEVEYTDQLAFTKAERLPNPNEERWVLDPNPKYVQKVNANQETMLVRDPNPPGDYSFVPPIDLHYPSSLAMNGVAKDGQNQIDIAFGFFPSGAQQPAQILCFHEIPEYTPVSLEFVPLMQAYFVPEDYYCEGEVLTMPIPSPLALEVDIRSLVDGKAKYTVSIDTSTNRAVIQKS